MKSPHKVFIPHRIGENHFPYERVGEIGIPKISINLQFQYAV
ncbi:MAG: hypothetical protein ACM3SR_00255 [Ignavibacteriales bacterium]